VVQEILFPYRIRTGRLPASGGPDHINVISDSWHRLWRASWLQKLPGRQSEQLDQRVLRNVVRDGTAVYTQGMWFRAWSRLLINARGTYVVPYLRAAWPYVRAGKLPVEVACEMAAVSEQSPACVTAHGSRKQWIKRLKEPTFAVGLALGLLMGIGGTVAWNVNSTRAKVGDRFDIVVLRQGYALKIDKQTGETWVISRTDQNQWAEEQTAPKN